MAIIQSFKSFSLALILLGCASAQERGRGGQSWWSRIFRRGEEGKPALKVTQNVATPYGFASVDEQVCMLIQIENTGNVSVTAISVTNDGLNVPLSGAVLDFTTMCTGLDKTTQTSSSICCDGGSTLTLSPGKTTKCYGCHSTTQEEIDRGFIVDKSVAEGTVRRSDATVFAFNLKMIPLYDSSCLNVSITPFMNSPASSNGFYYVRIANNCDWTLTNINAIEASPALISFTCDRQVLGSITLGPYTSIRCTARGALTREQARFAETVYQSIKVSGRNGLGAVVTKEANYIYNVPAWKPRARSTRRANVPIESAAEKDARFAKYTAESLREDFDPLQEAYCKAIGQGGAKYCGANMECYAALSVPADADTAFIKTRWRQLSTQRHPDKKSGDHATQVLLNRAKEILTDPTLRRGYDEVYHDSLSAITKERKARKARKAAEAKKAKKREEEL